MTHQNTPKLIALAASDYTKEKEYWIKTFSGELQNCDFPTDAANASASKSFTSYASIETLSRKIEGDTAARIIKLSKNIDHMLHMILMAGVSTLLSRFSGSTDIVLGVPIYKNENDLDLLNTVLPIRIKWDNQPNFKELLLKIRQTMTEAMDYQNYPYEMLLKHLASDMGISQPESEFRLFNVALILTSIHDKQYITGANPKILFSFSRCADSLSCEIEFNASFYKKESIDRFFNHLIRIFEISLPNPDIPIHLIDILPVEDKKQIVFEVNSTETLFTRNKCIHELFEDRAAQSPDAIAVIGHSQRSEGVGCEAGEEMVQLSYKELNIQAEGAANIFRQKGMAENPNRFVAVSMNRSIEMIIAVMGILKAGGAYVPLEPYLPDDRILYILKSLNIGFLLINPLQMARFESMRANLPELGFICSLTPSLIEEKIAFLNENGASTFSLSAGSPEDLAYVIFTSGSTGTPKGVAVKHLPVINIIEWVNRSMSVTRDDKVLFITSLAFDLSVYDIFGILGAGASIRLLSSEGLKSPTDQLDIIFRERITFWDSAPAALAQLVPFLPDIDVSKQTSHLRVVFLSGDWIPVAMPDALKNAFKGVRVISLGGATEATIWSNFYPIGVVEPHWPSIPYGKPTQNAAYFILDSHGNVCPYGVPGDLYISGECLAEGYINDPQLTSEKFIRLDYSVLFQNDVETRENLHGFIKRGGNVFYRTGDLARWLPEGNMEFLGRSDNQVKIRGYRIELGEIENQLNLHEGVKDVIVSAVGKNVRERILVAYVVPDRASAFPVSRWMEMERKGLFKDHPHHILPNGMPVCFLNTNETDFMFHEIFEESEYIKHGITLEDGACVFDIGANIGIFSLYVNRVCSDAKIFAFEPIPPVVECLRLNTFLHGVNATIYPCGVSGEEGQAVFTYYPHVSILSSRFAKIDEEKEALRTYLFNTEGNKEEAVALQEDEIEGLLIDRLESQSVSCPLKTISQVIRENGVTRIDLLKINVEKSEADVLKGIENEDWPKIRQIVVEIHDVNGRLNEITGLFERHGFGVTVEQEQVLGNTSFFHVYAVSKACKNLQRPQTSTAKLYPFMSSEGLIASMKDYLREKLPEYMIPQAFVLLEKIPVSPNGKVDRKALPKFEFESESNYVAPSGDIETRLAAIWKEVLGLDKNKRLGINDNFFELGGHSLKAANLVAKIHHVFDVKIPLFEVFQMPFIKDLAEHIASASKEIYSGIERVEEQDFYELSSAQKRLYFIYELQPQSIAYNMPAAVKLVGLLDTVRLKMAFETVIHRHESLRTSFHMLKDRAVQRCYRQIEFFPEVIDLTLERNAKQGKSVDHLIKEFIRPFDLSKAPLLRVMLIKEAAECHILAFDMHHIVSDGTSTTLFIEELVGIYSGKSFPELRIQYKDFAYWQNMRNARGEYERQESFWLKEFDGEIPVLNLPTDFPRAAMQDLTGNSVRFEIDERNVAALKKMVSENDTTLFIVLLALVNVLFHRLSGQSDIAIGTVSAGRVSADVERVMGMFVNTLALRNYPDGDKIFTEFLGEVKNHALAAFENQEYPFEALVEKLPVNRDTARNPLFDVIMNFQSIEPGKNSGVIESDQLKVLPYAFATHISKFDLIFHIAESGDGLRFNLEYAVNLFKEESIARIGRYFNQVISEIIRNPELRIGETDLLPDEEKRELLSALNGESDEWNGREGLSGMTLNEMFELQVEKFPDRIAVTGPALSSLLSSRVSRSFTHQMTYGELNFRSEAIAESLRQKGILPDDIVGILLEPSLETIVAIWGILKAGGAYLPIDPTYPEDRIKFMLDDANAKVLLTGSGVLEKYAVTSLQNLDFSSRCEIRLTQPRVSLTELDAQPIVDRSFVSYDKYSPFIGMAMVKQTITIQGSRGCPYHCAYCHKIWPKTHVFRSAEHIFKEVKFYYDLGIRRFTIIDDIFNLNNENSRKFFRMIIDNGLHLQLFFPNGMRGDILTEDYIDLMVSAGTTSIALALETASPRLQKLIGKHLNIEKLRKNLEYISQKHPHVILELFAMHGFPSETEEEALMTLNFIKSIKWLHFPYFHILKVYPNTDMAQLARDNGVSEKTIIQSANLAFHQLPETLPFEKSFTHQTQADFLNRYFLDKERLLHVLPYQLRILTEDEIVQKYNSYLPVEIKSLADLLNFVGIKREDIDARIDPNLKSDLTSDKICVPDLDRRIKEQTDRNVLTQSMSNLGRDRSHDASESFAGEPLRILLLDLSQHFSGDSRNSLYDVIEPPLGLMYLMTALKHKFGMRVEGKIAKSRIDFDSYEALKKLIEDVNPHLIGIRCLSYFKNFFHQTAAMIRMWSPQTAVITGGPYATSDYTSLLKDKNIDLAVLGEGELTICELVEKIIENRNVFPSHEQLEGIAGIAYVPENSSQLYGSSAREVIILDAFFETLKKKGSTHHTKLQCLESRNAAYVIYTSGTTGKPKGVMVEHGNITSLMRTGKILFDYNENDAWTMFHSYCFDFSVWEMYGALLYGGKLALIPRMTARDPQKYLELLKREQITILNQTPTVFYQLIDEEMKTSSGNLNIRFVIFGGEALKPGKLKPWHETYPLTRLINMYGITETTVHVTFKEITDVEISSNISNIGKPIASLYVYMMNPYLKMQPWNIPGELFVGGDGVARGYLNRPELTAERFLTASSTAGNESRGHKKIYRSGDLAKVGSNGEMEYLGRIDHQVKIRGNRVETGEIERQLMILEEIVEALVMAREDEKGNNYLCAYIRITPETESKGLAIPELRRKLLKNIPEYMIPSYFITLKEFPVTSTGKVDRRKLPLPEGFRPELGSVYAEPETEKGRIIASIWKELLKLDKVGINDNFFDLGGTSMEIVRLRNRLNETLGMDIPIAVLFENPTISSFTQFLGESKTDEPVDNQEKDAEIESRLQKGKDKMKSRRQRFQD